MVALFGQSRLTLDILLSWVLSHRGWHGRRVGDVGVLRTGCGILV